MNGVLSTLTTDMTLTLDDDHWLTKPMDVTPHIKKLVEDPTAGAIRLMQVGGHKLIATLDEIYWRVRWDSPELYITSFRPTLRHRRFWEVYGMLPEGLRTGQTEESFCHRTLDIARTRIMQGLPPVDVLIPLDVATESSWDHVGHSWQLEGL